MPRHWSAYGLICFVFLAQWLLADGKTAPTWDGVFYYSYARSIAFDGDLHFANDLQAAYPTSGDHFASKNYHEELTPTGYVVSPFAPGTPLLWLPYVWVAQLVMPEASGYEWYFIRPIASLTALLGLLAFLVGYRFSAEFVRPRHALGATVTLMFTTPLIYYQFTDPFYSHTASALTTALAVVAWWYWRERWEDWLPPLALGLLIGLAALVRWQHVLYLAAPGVYWLLVWWETRDFGRFPILIRTGLLLGLGVAIPLSLQLTIWRVLYGTWLTVPQGSAYMLWDLSRLGPTIFSPFRGLLAWLPILVPALIGLSFLARRWPRLVVALVTVLLLETYINGSSADWFGGGGYGPRRYSSELLLLVLGYAGFIDGVADRWRRWLALPLSLLLAWQQWTLFRFAVPANWGGDVIMMYPDYTWIETDWPTFLAQIGSRAGWLLTAPVEFWVAPRSIVFWLLRQRPVSEQLFGLLIGCGCLFAAVLLIGQLRKRMRLPYWVGMATIVCVVANVWLLLSA